MVAKITHPKSVIRPIYYNENKVAEGVAQCIYAGNFLKEPKELNLIEKKERFSQLIALNKGVQKHALHASINFAVGEKLGKEKMILIAQEYMERIGFGDQPYLVYEHLDAAHPHMHIVSTSIQSDGDAIDMHFIGRDKSEPARLALEEKYELIKAQGRSKGKEFELKPLTLEKLEYGKRATKQTIGNALQYIIREYRFRSLPEFNAILRLYNLKADPGQAGSRIHSHKGLMYQILDAKGKGVGVPIKASAFHFKPGLKFLEGKFKENHRIDPVLIARVRMAIDQVLARRLTNWDAFTKALAQQRIVAVPYINKEGRMYGLSFIDLQGKIVLKASDLGKNYSSQAILHRIGLDPFIKQATVQGKVSTSMPLTLFEKASQTSGIEQAKDILFRPEFQAGLPAELSQQPAKKKKRKSHKI